MNVALPFLLAIGLAAAAAPQQRAVPVENEPSHKTVFKNAYVQAFRVRLEPGQTSLMHIHAHDDAAVRFSSATAVDEPLGGPAGAPASFDPGIVSARTNEPTPLTHCVHNVGKTLFDVMDVQVLGRPPGPETPAVVSPAAENPKLRVYRYELEPGASTPPHTHARPFLLVAATPADLGVTSGAGTLQRRAMKPGDFEWFDGAVTHGFANRGTAKAVVVEFELK